MKTLKDRNTVKISVAAYEKMRDEVYQVALADGAKQGVAVCLIVLEKMLGWKRKRLTRFTENVNELLQFPDIFGKDLTGGDVIDYMKKTYEIDIDKLGVKVKYDKN